MSNLQYVKFYSPNPETSDQKSAYKNWLDILEQQLK